MKEETNEGMSKLLLYYVNKNVIPTFQIGSSNQRGSGMI